MKRETIIKSISQARDFITANQHEKYIAALARLGTPPKALPRGHQLLEELNTRKDQVDRLRAKYNNLGEDMFRAKENAHLMMLGLLAVIRASLSQDKSSLTILGLEMRKNRISAVSSTKGKESPDAEPQDNSNGDMQNNTSAVSTLEGAENSGKEPFEPSDGEQESAGKKKARPSQAAASIMVSWLDTLEGAKRLSGNASDKLAGFGVDAAHLERIRQSILAWSESCRKREEVYRLRIAAQYSYKKAEKDMLSWVTAMRRILRAAKARGMEEISQLALNEL